MTSRLPSVWPAYMNNELYFFDDAHLKERDYTYTSNYGMIPMGIVYSGKRYSFERLSKIYGFFKDYYYLLNHRGHCNVTYSSAKAFYDGESANYAEEMPYGTFEDTYTELDNKFAYYGGSSFYEWICKNIIPTYTISKAYTDYWKTETLYYPDVIKWIGWFDARSEYSAYTTESSCKNITRDCCECVEYVKRGGKAERDRMASWYSSLSIPSTITDKCFNPYAITPISIQTSIDDLGEMKYCLSYEKNQKC